MLCPLHPPRQGPSRGPAGPRTPLASPQLTPSSVFCSFSLPLGSLFSSVLPSRGQQTVKTQEMKVLINRGRASWEKRGTSSARMGNMLSFSQSPTPSLHHLWTAYRGCISRLFGVFYLTQLPSLHEHRLLRVKKGTCPVVEMPCFHCGGTGSIPGRGTKSPQAMQCCSRPSKEEKKYPF